MRDKVYKKYMIEMSGLCSLALISRSNVFPKPFLKPTTICLVRNQQNVTVYKDICAVNKFLWFYKLSEACASRQTVTAQAQLY